MQARNIGAVIVAAFALALPASASAGKREDLPLRPADATGPLGHERLSDEFRLTRWAHAARRGALRKVPSMDGKPFGRLHHFTEDGYREVYVLLQSQVDAQGREWVKVRVPKRPNGQRAWVRRDALGSFHLVTTRLKVHRRNLRARLWRDGKVIWQSRIGIGARGTPTPRGHFYIREKIRVADAGGLYGPWAFGTSAYSVLSDWPGGGVIGIHGTNQPQLIPGRPSHGCVRVPNRKIRRLAKLLPLGTPVRIY